MRLWPQDVFFTLSKEDHLFENLQVLFYALSAFISLHLSVRYWKKKKTYTAVFFLLFFIGLFFIGGEEISWGQRVFHITSPNLMQEINTKKETTVHNINGINQYQYLFYMAFSFFLSCSWLLLSIFPKKIQKKFITPNWYFVGFFLPIFFFYAYMNFFGGTHWEWQEYAELLLSIGLFLFLLKEYSSSKSSAKNW